MVLNLVYKYHCLLSPMFESQTRQTLNLECMTGWWFLCTLGSFHHFKVMASIKIKEFTWSVRYHQYTSIFTENLSIKIRHCYKILNYSNIHVTSILAEHNGQYQKRGHIIDKSLDISSRIWHIKVSHEDVIQIYNICEFCLIVTYVPDITTAKQKYF